LCGDELGYQWATDDCPNHPHFIKKLLAALPQLKQTWNAIKLEANILLKEF
jgi:hypothetical protein